MKFYQKRLRRNKIKEEKGKKKNVEERDGQQGRKMFKVGSIC